MARVHVQPVPLIAVAVKLAGNVSVTVTVPTVGPGPGLFTVRSYVPLRLCMKLPTCELVTVRSAAWMTVVESVAVSLAKLVSLPPEMVTVLVIADGALFATFTVSVIAG